MENKNIVLFSVVGLILLVAALFFYAVALDNVYTYQLVTPNGELSSPDKMKLKTYNRLQYVNSYYDQGDEGYLVLNLGKSDLAPTGEEAKFGFEKATMMERFNLWFKAKHVIKGELHEHFKPQLSGLPEIETKPMGTMPTGAQSEEDMPLEAQ